MSGVAHVAVLGRNRNKLARHAQFLDLSALARRLTGGFGSYAALRPAGRRAPLPGRACCAPSTTATRRPEGDQSGPVRTYRMDQIQAASLTTRTFLRPRSLSAPSASTRTSMSTARWSGDLHRRRAHMRAATCAIHRRPWRTRSTAHLQSALGRPDIWRWHGICTSEAMTWRFSHRPTFAPW
jgi:hypothetical protein